MAKIVHLRPNEAPPKGEQYMLLEWKPEGDIEVEQLFLVGSLTRASGTAFDNLLKGSEETADHLGYQTVYVKGKPE